MARTDMPAARRDATAALLMGEPQPTGAKFGVAVLVPLGSPRPSGCPAQEFSYADAVKTQRRRGTVSEPVFMAQIRAADIPESMPVSRAIRDFMVAHPPTPEGQPTEELLQLLMLSVMRLEGRVVVLKRRSEAGTDFLKVLAEIFPKQS